jgi:hypothetical protein
MILIARKLLLLFGVKASAPIPPTYNFVIDRIGSVAANRDGSFAIVYR